MTDIVENTPSKLLEKLYGLLKKLDDKIESEKEVKHLDLSRDAEQILIPFLNKAFNWNLENANWSKHNIGAIDLWNRDKKILVQVSSQVNKTSKIKNTHRVFQKSEDLKSLTSAKEVYYYFMPDPSPEETSRILKKNLVVDEKYLLSKSKLKKIFERLPWDELNQLYKRVTDEIGLTEQLTSSIRGVSNGTLHPFNGTELPTYSYLLSVIGKNAKVLINADEGRGKTELAKYLAAKYISSGAEVILFDLLYLDESAITQSYLQNLLHFICNRKGLIIVDNVHIAGSYFVQQLNGLYGQIKKSRVKIIFLARNTKMHYDLEHICQVSFSPDSDDIDKILKTARLRKFEKHECKKILGKNNFNLRIIDIYLKAGRGKKEALFSAFVAKMRAVYSVDGSSFENDELERELRKLATGSLNELLVFEIKNKSPRIIDFFNRLYKNGYLINTSLGYSFPHIFDCIAFLKGVNYTEYMRSISAAIIEFSSQKHGSSIDLNEFSSRIYILIRELNSSENREEPLVIDTYLHFKNWVFNNIDLSSRIFLQNIGLLNGFYYGLGSRLKDKNLVEQHIEILASHKNIIEDLRSSRLMDLDMLAVTSNNFFRDYRLIYKLPLVESGIAEKIKNSTRLGKIKRALNIRTVPKPDIIKQINIREIIKLKEDNVLYIPGYYITAPYNKITIDNLVYPELQILGEGDTIEFTSVTISKLVHFLSILSLDISKYNLEEFHLKKLIEGSFRTIMINLSDFIIKTEKLNIYKILQLYKQHFISGYTTLLNNEQIREIAIEFDEKQQQNISAFDIEVS